MAKYTTEVRSLHRQGFDFGLKDYPIFDPAYREVLNNKILAHYRYCEIGSETPGRFKHHLNTLMDEIMPYYNKLYRSELIEFNPLYNVDYTETGTKTTTGKNDATINRNMAATNDNTERRNLTDTLHSADNRTNTQTINTNTTNVEADDLLTVESDTPGGLLSIGDIKTNTWASKANKQDNTRNNTTENTGTVGDVERTSSDESRTNTGTVVNDGESTLNEEGNTKTTINNLDDYVKRVVGNTGGKNYAEMLLDFRATFLNIDLMIIKDLKQLFMGVY